MAKVEIVNEPNFNEVTLDKMKEGDIGIIVEWTAGSYIGMIVQRSFHKLIEVGGTSTWPSTIFIPSRGLKVRILPKGTEIRIIV